MNKLKACPFCQEPAKQEYDVWATVVHKEDCLFYREEDDGRETYDISRWQSRPTEDALHKLLNAAKHALLSYQYGNSSPELAETMVAEIERVWNESDT